MRRLAQASAGPESALRGQPSTVVWGGRRPAV